MDDLPEGPDKPEPAHKSIAYDNQGTSLLRVPGFNDIPLDHELPSDARFAHGIQEWRQAPAVTARELAMVATINRLTDSPNWHIEVSNTAVVARWRETTCATTPLMSDRAWDWCVRELCDKAEDFRQNGHIRVLDAGSCICKADGAALRAPAGGFRRAVRPVLRGLMQRGLLDWRSKRVLAIVDPGLKRLLQLGVYTHHGGTAYRWSANYQALPCEVEFVGTTGTQVRSTSYINNLHPAHTELYRVVEELLGRAIPLWNDCLVQGRRGWTDRLNQSQLGPVPLRIITYGVEWENELPEWLLAFRVPSEVRKKLYRKAREAVETTKGDDTEEGRERHCCALERLEGFRDVAGSEDKELPPQGSELWHWSRSWDIHQATSMLITGEQKPGRTKVR
ncbi:hypothetical protein BO71DRAFT_442888 [Aspergillus ellipticus CBS 707.79]|uniref:Uncharacterized protein n=1 Tax=Aspergillus ellipticus CBS 707.79 TaxID=1448320 RepID=A0A319D3Y6_9EURO|nr:hypothetical protein BO71DRAFT_442888 [Aspergillus ellipticus CBS 707.79]